MKKNPTMASPVPKISIQKASDLNSNTRNYSNMEQKLQRV
jgi:hypothetical protein